MSHPSFTVSVIERIPLLLFGIPIRTTMQQAAADCPRLWSQVFGPRMREPALKPADPALGESYGVSVMDDEDSDGFTYWAAMPPAPGSALPDGMQQTELPGGLYAHVRVPSLQLLESAFTFVYLGRPKELAGYTVNRRAPCFERYTEEWLSNGSLEIYVPVDKSRV